MTKNIWWINHHAVPPVVPGGTRHFSLAKSLKKLNYETTIINGSFDHLNSHFQEKGDFGQNLKEPLLRSYEGVDFYSIPTPYYVGNASIGRVKNMLAFYFGAMKYLRGKTELPKPDLIIGSVVHPFAAYAGYRLSKYYKVPFVYEVRDLWPRTLVELGRISSKHPFVLLLDRLDGFLAKKAEIIITSAPLMKNHYKERFGIKLEKCLWITNGSVFTRKTPSPMRKIEENDPIKVGYTGAIGLANGIKEFLEELKNVPKETLKRFKFTFVGGGPLKQELAAYSLEKGLPVEFKNSVPKDQVWNLLQEFDFLLFCLIESKLFKNGISPNKLADYHSAGRPIIEIVSCDSSPVQSSGAGYHADSFGELPKILSAICSADQKEYTEKGKKGYLYAQEQYDWDKLAEKIHESLKVLL